MFLQIIPLVRYPFLQLLLLLFRQAINKLLTTATYSIIDVVKNLNGSYTCMSHIHNERASKCTQLITKAQAKYSAEISTFICMSLALRTQVPKQVFNVKLRGRPV